MDLFENFLKVVLEDTWPLPRHYRAHLLQGNLKGVWDVHLRHNWVIFFQKKETVITLLRTGTHAYLGIG
jgi:addiction module RelE/StbE family toxin